MAVRENLSVQLTIGKYNDGMSVYRYICAKNLNDQKP